MEVKTADDTTLFAVMENKQTPGQWIIPPMKSDPFFFFLILVFTLIVLLSYTRQKYSEVSFSVFQHIQEKGTTTPPKCLNTPNFATPVNPSQIVYFLAPPACFSFTCGQITSLFACVYGSMATKRVALPQREPWRRKENWEERSYRVYFGWKKEEKRNDRNELEGSRDREAENAGEGRLEHTRVGGVSHCCCYCRWKAEWGAHVETIIQQMTPDSIIHRPGHVSQPAAAPADWLHVLVGVCFLLLSQLAQTAISFLIVPKKMMTMSEKW